MYNVVQVRMDEYRYCESEERSRVKFSVWINLTTPYPNDNVARVFNIGGQRSKEDEVHKISTSVFITNFPELFTAKELWNVFKQYGNVVDAYIPNRRSKVVKEISSLSNLKMGLATESFDNIDLKYMGGYWQASNEFIINGKVTWVEIEGVPLKMWPDNTFTHIDSRCGVLLHVRSSGFVLKKSLDDNKEESDTDDDTKEGDPNEVDVGLKSASFLEGVSDVKEVPETKYEEELHKINLREVSVGKKNARSEYPFNIYELLNKKQGDTTKDSCLEDSVKYPPDFMLIDLMDDMVKVGQTMGHNMEGCIKNIEEIIESQGVNGDTKMEAIEIFNIKMCWRNFAFDYVFSSSVGNSGGILCVWDPRSFHKINATVSNYFVMIRGVWLPNGNNLLIISVYAPQELSEKKMLWDYLFFVIANWKGEVVMMGDYNEVRKKEERFGSSFNVQGADAFNLFIRMQA
uniref:RNA-directed DNA polymerase, eukaryota n=1 Tax=Tanacetum cinerariifolium TaxID=118510 RepID=A0A6L2MTA6_TANCI|nr:RNA-directed DNA polymerase, eukaryota [Tanacetum cinerariifolium]